MSSQEDWIKAFARQARADLGAWKIINGLADVPVCHKLQFFQMACEKLCKAHRLYAGATPDDLRSHAQMQRFLSAIVNQELIRIHAKPGAVRGMTQYVNHLAKNLDALSPAVTAGGKREDNCEYPWEDGTDSYLTMAKRGDRDMAENQYANAYCHPDIGPGG